LWIAFFFPNGNKPRFPLVIPDKSLQFYCIFMSRSGWPNHHS
jgi:hypothetical protein